MSHYRALLVSLAPSLLVAAAASADVGQDSLRVAEGVVVDANTRMPLADTWVTTPSFGGSTQTQSDGRFTLPLPSTPHNVRIYHEGYVVRSFNSLRRLTNSPDTLTDTIALLPYHPGLSQSAVSRRMWHCSCTVIDRDNRTPLPKPTNRPLGVGSQPLVATSLYGRELTELIPWGRSDLIFATCDPATGMPLRLEGGGIHVQEICPQFDSLTEVNAAEIAYTFICHNAEYLGVDPSELVVQQVREFMMASRNGSEAHVTFDQIHGGIRVFASTVRLIFKLNHLYMYESGYIPIKISIEPTLTAAEAFAVAKTAQEKRFMDSGYPEVDLQCKTVELRIGAGPGDKSSSTHPPRLVWRIECCPTLDPFTHMHVTIDAHSGELIKSVDLARGCGL